MNNSTLSTVIAAPLSLHSPHKCKCRAAAAAAPTGRLAMLRALYGPALVKFAFPAVAFPGLVICAITRGEAPGLDAVEENDGIEAAIRRLLVVEFKFPSARDLRLSAATFLHPVNPVSFRRAGRRDSELREGPTTYVDIAPGLVRLRRTDPNRSARTVERRLLAEESQREQLRAARSRVAESEAVRLLELQRSAAIFSGLHVEFTLAVDSPAWLAFAVPVAPSQRGMIAAWSSKSRARLVSTICELDLSVLVSGQQLPGMLTLTLPGDWLAVAPNHAVMARKFDNFLRAWADKFGEKSVNIWKREFQRRGAPHYHLWLVPPSMTGGVAEFREWVALAWTSALGPSNDHSLAGGLLGPVREPLHGVKGARCICSEWCRSLAGGTGLDFAEAMRARDPRRLAVYFLKESLGGESKAYQNSAPAEWLAGWVDHSAGVAGPLPCDAQKRPSMGRFWGIRGIAKSVQTIEVESSVGVQVARTLRRWQRAQGTTEIVRLRGGRVVEFRTKITRETSRLRRDASTGELTGGVWRNRRPARVIGGAGWVAVNDGATFSTGVADAEGRLVGGLSRMVERLTGELVAERAFAATWEVEPAVRDWMPVGGFVPRMHGPCREGEFYSGPPVEYRRPAAPAVPVILDLDARIVAYGETLREWFSADPERY